ncbi:MAG: glycosyltransferase [candidate division WOR-3 bacterium]|nr:MAG: glycosyltransferase [candidate division WOR-3 bacterium]
MRRVLVIAYYTPPLGLSGVMRVTKLCKYLPEFGWRPVVLTVKPPAYYHYDHSLLKDLDASRVYRTESADPARLINRFRPVRSRLSPALYPGLGKVHRLLNYLLFPDSKVGWFPFGSVSGRHVVDQEKPSAIFATAPPFTSLLLGVRLKAHARLPLVADFRDPWPTGFAEPPRHLRAPLRAIRRYVVRHADAVLAVNRGTADMVGSGVRILDNGFDPEDFDAAAEKLEGFSVLHVGNVWQNEAALEDVARAIAQVPDGRLYLAGRFAEPMRRTLERNDRIGLLGTLPHGRACRLMKGADILLYLGKPGQPVGIKLYEYLGASRPILVYGPDTSEAADLVSESGSGLECQSSGDIAQALLRLRDTAGPPAIVGRARFDRREQAGRLARLFESLV